MQRLLSLCVSLAPLAAAWGILLTAASSVPPTRAADALPASPWGSLIAQRDELNKQSKDLIASGRSAEAAAVAEKLIAVDRQVLGLLATNAAEIKMQQDVRHEAVGKLQWIVDQEKRHEDWPAAAARQRELADILAADAGTAPYRVVDARDEHAYLARLSTLDREAARKLAKAEADLAKSEELDGQGRYGEAIPLAQAAVSVRQQLLGAQSTKVASSLNWLGKLYKAQGDYARAEPLYRQALAIDRKALGEKHPDYAVALFNLARLYHDQGNYALAEPAYQQAADTLKNALGENNSRYANGLNALALLYREQGKFARAESLYRQALQIYKAAVGENHVDYAMGLDNLASLYDAQGDYVKAERFHCQALEVRKKVLGENHPTYAISLNNLARFYQDQGDLGRAEPLLQKAVEIWKSSLGESHPLYATGLHNLAGFYQDQGNYAKAEPLFLKALEIRKTALGEGHPDYALSLATLARLYHRQGNYARAEPFYRQAMEVRKKVFGEDHPNYALSLGNLAGLYKAEGDYARAEPLLRSAVEINKKFFGENHTDYAASLSNLGRLYEVRGDLAQAEPLFRQALQIVKKAVSENHPAYAEALDDLAGLYYRQGDAAAADPLWRQALEIKKRVWGENHPDYAHSLSGLALLYEEQEDYKRAEPLLRQALEIQKKTIGQNSPFYLTSLVNLAAFYRVQNDFARAEPFIREAMNLKFIQLDATAVIQSERQQLAMLESARAYLNYYLMVTSHLDQFALPAYRQVLAWKGVVFRRARLVRAGAQTPQSAALFRQLQQVTGQLAQETWATGDPRRAARGRENAARLSEEKERLEAELSAQSATFRRAQAPVTVEDVQAALPAGAAFIDFLEFFLREPVAVPQRAGLGVRFEQTDSGSKLTTVFPGGAAARDGRLQPGDLIVQITDHAGQWTATAGKTADAVRELMIGDVGSQVNLRIKRGQEAENREIMLTRRSLPTQPKTEWKLDHRYVAFVVRHDGPVVRIDLGRSEPINEAVDAWRETFGMSPRSAASGKLLREKVWEPIVAQIHDATIVLLSPDQALSKLPFGALPGGQVGRYLIEEYPLAIVPAAQTIPEFVHAGRPKPLPGNLLLVGNIDYDGQSPQSPAAPRLVGPVAPGLPQAFIHFDRLPATQREVVLVEKLYHQDMGTTGVQTLEGDQATKTAFLAAAGRYRYLHLATHGFYIPEKAAPAAAVSQPSTGLLGGPPPAELHVRLLSGLAMAGANQAVKEVAGNATAGDPTNNGILTAEEIAAQNLDGVQLVTLSACETGLGKAAGGEGLLGLQRSFQAAGARSVVASLWKVPDEETRLLMGAFYMNLWQKKLSPLESLRQAQLAMLRTSGAPDGRLRAPDFSKAEILPDAGAVSKPAAVGRTKVSPAAWAAFVLSGDWR